MNLTTLRRLVWAADAAALVAAGAAGWFSLRAAPAPARDWGKLFPVRQAQGTDLQAQGPAPKEEYTASITFPQGDKPVEVKPSDAPPPPPVDEFKEKYRLHAVFKATTMSHSFAQLATGQGSSVTVFSIGLGQRIPAEPGALQDPPQVTAWRLNELREARYDPATKQVTPCAAVFVNVENEKQQVLEMVAGNFEFPPPKEIQKGPGIGRERPPGPARDQPFRAVRVPTASPNQVVWEIAEEEVEFLGVFAEEELKRLSTVESKDAEGRPDGVLLKGVPAGSRAAEMGFKSEDKIVSVNGEKVTSTGDALTTGKRQHETGKTSFEIKVLRQGKEISFMFHAPRKKAKP